MGIRSGLPLKSLSNAPLRHTLCLAGYRAMATRMVEFGALMYSVHKVKSRYAYSCSGVIFIWLNRLIETLALVPTGHTVQGSLIKLDLW